VDAQLHALSAELLLEDPGTLLVVTSDHGEEIGDHGSLGHAHTLHEELLRVPMLFRWPAAIPEGGRRDVPVSLLDVMPTLEELVGRGRPGRQGRSLWPLLRRAGALPVLPMLFQLHAPRPAFRGMRLGDHKLIEDVGAARCGAQALALYDLARDSAEERDLGAEDPALAQELAARMSAFFASLPASPEPSRQEVDDGTLEELRSLGYVGP
jgi:arylsulfatase A-like enzyme